MSDRISQSNKQTPATSTMEVKTEKVSESGSNKETTPEQKLSDAKQRLERLKQKKRSETPREQTRTLAQAYTNMGKRERKSPLGQQMLSELQQQAKKNGFELRVLKSGGMSILDEKGKKIKPSFKKRSEEDIADSKKVDEYRKQVLNEQPVSMEHFIAMELASGTRFNKEELERLVGEKADLLHGW